MRTIDIGIPGIDVAGAVRTVLEAIAKILGLSFNNSMRGTIQILALAPSADFNADWFRRVLSATFAVVILMLFFNIVYRLITAAFVSDLAPFVVTLINAARAFLIIPFMPFILSVALWLSDKFSQIAVQVGSIGTGSPTAWQTALIAANPSAELTQLAWNRVLGFLLFQEVTPLQQMAYLYAILFTLTLGTAVVSGTGGFFFRWSLAALLSSIFSRTLMLFILSLGGNIISHANPSNVGDGSLNSTVVATAAFVPLVLFIAFVVGTKRAQRASASSQSNSGQAGRSASNDERQYVNRTSRGAHARRAATHHTVDKGLELATPAIAGAVGVTIGAVLTPAAGKAAASVTTVGVGATRAAMRSRLDPGKHPGRK